MPVITIGRQFGAGGTTVGEMLAQRLKVDVLDSQLINKVAQRLQPLADLRLGGAGWKRSCSLGGLLC